MFSFLRTEQMECRRMKKCAGAQAFFLQHEEWWSGKGIQVGFIYIELFSFYL